MKFSHTMDMSAKIKRALIALVAVFFIGQSALAQTEAEIERDIKLEKYDVAMEKARKMLAVDPKNDKVHYLTGQIYLLTDRLNEASAAFQKGQGFSARNPMNFVGAGAVAVKQENHAKAKADLDKAVELNAKNDPKVFLAIAKAWMGNPSKDKQKQQPYWTEAELYLYKVQKLAPNDPESYVLLGQLYGLQGVKELEQSMYEKAIQLDPNYIDGYYRLGVLYKDQQKYQEAADMFQKAIAIDAGFGPVYREMATMWTMAKKYDKAEESINKYLEIMGGDKSSLIQQMIIYYLGEQYDKAIEIGERVIKDTNATVVKRLLAYSYVKKATPDADKSMTWFDAYWNAVEKNPGAIIVTDYEFYGKAFQIKGNNAEAVKNYELAVEKAKATGEPNYDLYSAIAEMYKAQQDTVNRIVYLRKFILSQPPTKYPLKENFELGQAYYHLKDYMHADSIFDVMTQKKPELHIGWSWRGRSNAMMDPGSTQGKALPYYQKVLDLLGSDPEKIAKYKTDYITALNYFGSYHALVTEKYAEAKPFWQKVIELDPTNENATKGLEYIKAKGG
jgi:tetratricopeptide (TPR) repeat protein